MKMTHKINALGILLLGLTTTTNAALLTFDDTISGVATYSFDGDGDTIEDAIFSTTDLSGFNTIGPGPNMSYITEPGLEGTTFLSPDLRVDFLNGAAGSLSYGFAIDGLAVTVDTWALFEVYDAFDNLIGSDFEYGAFTLPDTINPSSFPEGIIEVSFSGLASYALFDFGYNSDSLGGTRYIIDNFDFFSS